MRKAKEISVQELDEGNSYRTERGYLYLVDASIGGNRYRRFFRHGEIAKARAYVSSLKAKRDNFGQAKAAILEDPRHAGNGRTRRAQAYRVRKPVYAGRGRGRLPCPVCGQSGENLCHDLHCQSRVIQYYGEAST